MLYSSRFWRIDLPGFSGAFGTSYHSPQKKATGRKCAPVPRRAVKKGVPGTGARRRSLYVS